MARMLQGRSSSIGTAGAKERSLFGRCVAALERRRQALHRQDVLAGLSDRQITDCGLEREAKALRRQRAVVDGALMRQLMSRH